MKKLIFVLTLCLFVAFLSRPAVADIHESFDEFWVTVRGDVENWNEVDHDNSGGSGYTTSPDGPWFLYEAEPGHIQTDPWGNQNPVPGWANQWYYDAPYDPTKWKEIDIAFTYARESPGIDGSLEIVINYSMPEWSPNPNGPPLPGQEDSIGWVEDIARLAVMNDNPINTSLSIDLRDYGINYNPEWISIDVVGYGFLVSSPENPGSFVHRCVPEPGTISLLGLGVLALLRRYKK